MEAIATQQDASPAANEVRFCGGCMEHRAVGDFWRRSGGVKGCQTWCKECVNRYKRDRTAKRRSKDINHFASELLAVKQDRRRIAVLCREMIQQFRGVEAFAKAWHSEIMAVTERLPGSRTGLRGFQAIAALAEASSRMTPPPREPEEMSREEMITELRFLMPELTAVNQE